MEGKGCVRQPGAGGREGLQGMAPDVCVCRCTLS